MNYFIYSFMRRTSSALLYRRAYSEGFANIAQAKAFLTEQLRLQGIVGCDYRFVYLEFPIDAAPSAVQVDV